MSNYDPVARNYEDFGNAIVFQAVRDYQRGLCKLHDNQNDRKGLYEVKETTNFLKSDWCSALTKTPGEVLIKMAEDQIRDCGYDMKKLKSTYGENGKTQFTATGVIIVK